MQSRKHVTAVLKGKYDTLKVEIREELAQVEAVALTGDFWTSIATIWELLPTSYHQTGFDKSRSSGANPRIG